MERKWIGLAEVVPNVGCTMLGSDNVGAVVNVVALAASERAFVLAIESGLAVMGLRLLNLEDVDLYASRLENYSVDETLRSEAERVPSELTVAFGRFHTYPLTGDH